MDWREQVLKRRYSAGVFTSACFLQERLNTANRNLLILMTFKNSPWESHLSVFCFLNTDIQIGTLFWGKYQVLSCPTQIKNLKISNEADLKKNGFHPHSLLATGRGEPGRGEGKNLWLKPMTVWPTGLRVPWPLPGCKLTPWWAPAT